MLDPLQPTRFVTTKEALALLKAQAHIPWWQWCRRRRQKRLEAKMRVVWEKKLRAFSDDIDELFLHGGKD